MATIRPFYAKRFFKSKTFIAIALAGIIALFYFIFSFPLDFPENQTITIKSGETLSEIANTLKEAHVLRSTVAFNTLMIALQYERGAVSGTYLFKKPLSAYEIAQRIGRGEFGFPVKDVLIPEGTTVKGISELIPEDFSYFVKADFIKVAAAREGYLFPDTYSLPTNLTAYGLINTLENNFDKKTSALQEESAKLGKRFSDIIIIASILEEEAGTPEDRRLVSGIIQNRLAIGMALQVDATLDYERGKNTYELTTADLRKDSPFNTYTRKGLPPAPISNPGLDAIDAALHPKANKYLYYLSDKHSVIHYAETFAGHERNRALYLK